MPSTAQILAGVVQICLRSRGTAVGQIIAQRGDVAAVQLLDQVQCPCQTQLRRVAVHHPFSYRAEESLFWPSARLVLRTLSRAKG